MSLTPLGPGLEFDIIRRILKGASEPRDPVALGAGDDCALIQVDDGYLAVSVDLSVEEGHFLSTWGDPGLIGGRATRAALSDLAAMAAEPLAILLSVNVPAAAAGDLAEEVGRGCRAAAEALGASVIGGDVSRAGGLLCVDIVALGTVREPLLRSGARAGDGVWVTGTLGAAGAAVRAWKSGGACRDEWRERFWTPVPRIKEARWLAERGVAAAIDISDGLVADCAHLAAASGVGIELDWEAVPTAGDVDAELAMSAGEDFELIVVAAGGILESEASDEFRDRFGIPLTRVGRCVVGAGVRVFHGGEEVPVACAGFDHFGGRGESG